MALQNLDELFPQTPASHGVRTFLPHHRQNQLRKSPEDVRCNIMRAVRYFRALHPVIVCIVLQYFPSTNFQLEKHVPGPTQKNKRESDEYLVPWGLAGLSHFIPPGTLGTESHQKDWCWRVIAWVPWNGTGTPTTFDVLLHFPSENIQLKNPQPEGRRTPPPPKQWSYFLR